jgi:hypothetical protein
MQRILARQRKLINMVRRLSILYNAKVREGNELKKEIARHIAIHNNNKESLRILYQEYDIVKQHNNDLLNLKQTLEQKLNTISSQKKSTCY